MYKRYIFIPIIIFCFSSCGKYGILYKEENRKKEKEYKKEIMKGNIKNNKNEKIIEKYYEYNNSSFTENSDLYF